MPNFYPPSPWNSVTSEKTGRFWSNLLRKEPLICVPVAKKCLTMTHLTQGFDCYIAIRVKEYM